VQAVDAQRELDRTCDTQAGLVTAAQARGAGLSSAVLARLIRQRMLEVVDLGVYLSTACAAPAHLEIRAAWLRLDPAARPGEREGLGPSDGVVSHRSACVVLELGDIPAPAVELMVPRRRRTAAPFVTLHQRRGLIPDQVLMFDGLPVTTAERTIVDLLRDGADGGHLGGVIAGAEHRACSTRKASPGASRGSRPATRCPGAGGLELLQMLAAAATTP
jgi:hypothetical protein